MESTGISHPTVLTLNLPSFTILALDSQVCCRLFGSFLSHRYDKLIQLRPCVFLACFGDCSLIDQIRDALLSDPPQNPRFVGDLAVFVQNTVNKVLGNARDADGGGGGGNNDNRNVVEFVLIGRCDLDSRCYVFHISKGPNNTWMCFAKRVVEKIATATTTRPVGYVTKFVGKNVLNDENIKEDEAVDYALRCMKYAEKNSWVSGGKILVVVVKPGNSIVHAWEKNDPSDFISKYIYRGKRISEGY